MLKLKRVENWKTKLTALINDQRDLPFMWGTHDCFNWAADGILTITGHDIIPIPRGSYTTPIGAAKQLLKVLKCHQPKEFMNNNFRHDHIAFARPGDIVYKNSNENGFNAAMGICYGQKSFFIFESDLGLFPIETLDLDGCWNIA